MSDVASVLKFSILTALLACVAACVNYGPQTIPRDRFDYGQAIADSWEEQMLVNMLRVRYGEAPVFLDVSQVINQYALEGQFGVQGLLGGVPSAGTDALGAEGGVRWADRPTITYTPLVGHRFTRSLLTPIDPAAVFVMIESGWPADLVFTIVVRSINGVRNDLVNATFTDPKFEPLMAAIVRLQKSNAIDISVERGGEEAKVHITFYREYLGDDARADIALVRSTLKLGAGKNEFVLRAGTKPSGKNEIYLQTRTMLEIMEGLSFGISVPPEHVDEGRTRATPGTANTALKAHRVFRVQHSIDEPENALVAVQNRDYWFAVDDRDYASKQILALLMVMLNLAESDERKQGPVITIGAGS